MEPVSPIDRRLNVLSIVMTNAVGTTGAIDVRNMVSGGFIVPASWTSIVIHGSADGVTYGPLATSTGSVGSINVTAADFFTFPDAIAGCAFIKVVRTGGADATVSVCRKS